MFTTTKKYVDVEEVDLRHYEDITQVPWPDHPPRHNDKHCDEQRIEDRDHRYDDRERRPNSRDRDDG
jgi:hypothetical protein